MSCHDLKHINFYHEKNQKYTIFSPPGVYYYYTVYYTHCIMKLLITILLPFTMIVGKKYKMGK